MNLLRKTFSINGTDTRLNFLAYIVAMAAALVCWMALVIATPPLVQGELPPAYTMAFGALVVVVGGVAIFLSASRRFRDMGQSPWLSLLLFIPIVSTVTAIILLCVKGRQNDVG